MRIAVIGAGAMGSLYGGYLSRKNDVLLVDVNPAQVQAVNEKGLLIHEPDDSVTVCRPKAASDTKGMKPVDLVMLFVKSMYSEAALESNRSLIGPDTLLMTLQNGSGHEEVLLRFADRAHIVIGTTQHVCGVLGAGEIRHAGSGRTCIGVLEGDAQRLASVAQAFEACGLETTCEAQVQRLVWNKLFTNVSASVLTGILQVPLGEIARSRHAWALCETLVREAAAVAAGDGYIFDAEEKIAEVRTVCENSPEGLTSIYADLRSGRRTEVDAISGSVVRAGRRNGVPAPTHEAMVALVHALEDKAAHQKDTNG
ncbi:MAG: 2-dehydropantoate 2-reductase [Christensenellales bacterium]|nr:2-dehydropantoate 2-reductase [Christensenellales bacterium]